MTFGVVAPLGKLTTILLELMPNNAVAELPQLFSLVTDGSVHWYVDGTASQGIGQLRGVKSRHSNRTEYPEPLNLVLVLPAAMKVATKAGQCAKGKEVSI